MTYRPLVPCKGCARHVLAGEAACPFCGASLQAPSALRRADLPRRPTRAMLFTFGAALSTAACGSTVVGTDGGGGADVMMTPDTGTPTDRVTPVDTGTDTGPGDTGVFPSDTGMGDDVTVAPPYGVPPKDAGPDDDGGIMAEYGAPPRDAGPPAADAGAPDDDGGTNADYGAPPDRDGGGGIMPLYGSPPALDDAWI